MEQLHHLKKAKQCNAMQNINNQQTANTQQTAKPKTDLVTKIAFTMAALPIQA